VGGEARDFVSQALRGDGCNFIDDAFVGVEIEGQTGVVFLDEDAGGPFGGFGTNATHVESEETWGGIKETVGWAVGSTQTEAEGKVEKEKGKIRKEANS
jgi:hypothetical protein